MLFLIEYKYHTYAFVCALFAVVYVQRYSNTWNCLKSYFLNNSLIVCVVYENSCMCLQAYKCVSFCFNGVTLINVINERQNVPFINSFLLFDKYTNIHVNIANKVIQWAATTSRRVPVVFILVV